MPIVLSLFIAGLILAGHAATSARGSSALSLDRVALACAAGILLDYSLVLCGFRLTHALIAIGVLAAWGLVKAARNWRSARSAPAGRSVSWWTCLPIAYILGLYYVVVLSEPIFRWDARVIWFFHAKMIWSEGALRQHAGFGHPSIAFSGPAYPNLVPAIAAQLAWMRGFWNEFLPKASLIVILLPPVLWVFSFGRFGGLVLLVLFSFFSLDGWLASGLMDPFLGLYLGMALLLFGRYLEESRTTDLLSTVCALGIITALKSEGQLILVSFVAALLAVGFSGSRGLVVREVRRLVRDRLFLRVVLLSAAPALIWAVLKRAWGLRDAMTADLTHNAAHLVERVSDGSSMIVLFKFLVTRPTALWLLASLFCVAVALHTLRRRRVPGGAVVAALTSLFYFLEMYVVYLSTPVDMTWHLTLSAPRTMFAVSVALIVALYLVLTDGTGEGAPTGAATGPGRAAG